MQRKSQGVVVESRSTSHRFPNKGIGFDWKRYCGSLWRTTECMRSWPNSNKQSRIKPSCRCQPENLPNLALQNWKSVTSSRREAIMFQWRGANVFWYFQFANRWPPDKNRTCPLDHFLWNVPVYHSKHHSSNPESSRISIDLWAHWWVWPRACK